MALSVTLQVAHVSTGQLFRETIRRGGPTGQAAQQFIEKGQLVPDAVVIAIVRGWLEDHGNRPEFIFDGFPRTTGQAVALDAMMRERSLPAPVVILIEVPPEVTLERILGRLGCETCGALYHATFDPPKRAGECDKCGSALGRRADDNETTVRERLRWYEELTLGVVAHYAKAAGLRRVDGCRGRQQVFADILRIVKG